MLPDDLVLERDCATVAWEDPAWTGEESRVFGADLVQFDEAGTELRRDSIHFSGDPYHPTMGMLQQLAWKLNRGLIDRR